MAGVRAAARHGDPAPTDVARRGIDFVIGNARRTGAPYAGVNYHGGGVICTCNQVCTCIPVAY